MRWPFKKPEPKQEEKQERGSMFSTDFMPTAHKKNGLKNMLLQYSKVAPASSGITEDSAAMDSSNGLKEVFGYAGSVPEAQGLWYANQAFIGYQFCAILAQQWLVDKACRLPGRDAVRQGFEVTINSGDDVDPRILDAMRAADKRHNINGSMREFVHFARIFGIRIGIFTVSSTDQDYYKKPFNIDGVTPGSYKGISQVDPRWIIPELTSVSLNDPAAMNFYKPTFWNIGGKSYHHSHLAIYIPYPVVDILKPLYRYGGLPLTQLIYERVYAAERTANEGPQLAMTKRLTGLKVSAVDFYADPDKSMANLEAWAQFRDNYGVKVVDKESEDIVQFDTALGDLDATIMTQYQLVSSIANMPATKLLGTTPKGFNATGEYEEANYREELEGIQSDITSLLERHHQLVMKSEVAPKFGIYPMETTVCWNPLDSYTAEEQANINKTKADTDLILANAGAIDGMDIRERVTNDTDSGYNGLAEIVEPEPEEEPVLDALDSALFNSADGTYAGARLITNQTYLDPSKVDEKTRTKDYQVQVSPEFPNDSGTPVRVVIDGHHSLAAALRDGVTPWLVEENYIDSNYHNAITKGVALDEKAQD